jgi:hypothetical protein
MSKLEDISEYIREQLAKYVGATNTDDLRRDITQDVANIINEAREKFSSAWSDGSPRLGDLVEARIQGLILEPDDWSTAPWRSNGSIVFTLMLPGNPLLVLAVEGREKGKIRVMSTFSGEIGWISITNLRPFDL